MTPGGDKARQTMVGAIFPTEPEGTFHVRVALSTEPPFLESSGNAARVFAVLAGTTGSVESHCQARFEYPTSFATSLVQLPFRPVVSTPNAFDEIRGFRAVKLGDDGEVLYSAIVDSYDLKTIAHDVFCQPELRLSGTFLRSALQAARRILDSFFIERTIT